MKTIKNFSINAKCYGVMKRQTTCKIPQTSFCLAPGTHIHTRTNMVLWKKESSRADACYINLLSGRELNPLSYDLFKLMSSTKKDDMKSIELRMEGNRQFIAKKWNVAMELYNQSLRLASDGSEHVSLVYANRSACFLQMKEYGQCLADIELAKKANYPDRLMHKLVEREASCLKLMNDEPPKLVEELKPMLSFDADEKFPCLANVLEIRNNDEFGNHIVAMCDIDVGQIVIVEDVYASSVFSTDTTVCRTCLKSAQNFIPAENCSDAMFCDESCIAANGTHNFVCGTPCNQCRLLGLLTELVLKAITAFPSNESLMEFVLADHSFKSHGDVKYDTEAQSKHDLLLSLYCPPEGDVHSMVTGTISSVYNCVLEMPVIKDRFQSKRDKRFLMHLILQHWFVLERTTLSFSSMSKTQSKDANTVVIFQSLLNHSCFPNVSHQRHGNQMITFTVRPIKMGEQLVINNGLNTKNATCKCSKCRPNWHREDRRRMQSDPDFKDIKEFKGDGTMNPDQRKDKMVNFLTKYGSLPWSPEIEEVIGHFKNAMFKNLSN